MVDNVKTVRDFIAAWSRLDPDELAGYFTDDGVYYNMPSQPVAGRDNVRSFIKGFAGGWASTQWDVLNIVGSGDVVIAERVDRTKTKGGKGVDLPCCGVFEMQNGKIRVWRDYFDLGFYMKAVS
jgi:limonene-1,2-epoxide hydrolase